MSLLVKARRDARDIVDVTPASAGWRYVGFSAHRLAAGETLALDRPGREIVHRRAVRARRPCPAAGQVWADIGGRASVFDDAAPYAVYLPDGAGIAVQAATAAEIGVAHAPGGGRLPARLIEPATMKRSVRGKGANTRYVCDILPQTEPAEHLLVVEVRTPVGPLVVVPAAQARHGQPARRELAGGDLLPPARSRRRASRSSASTPTTGRSTSRWRWRTTTS